MLTLTRKENKSIVCTLPNGDKVKVEIRQLENNKVRILIGAPYNALIIREL